MPKAKKTKIKTKVAKEAAKEEAKNSRYPRSRYWRVHPNRHQ